MEEGAHSFTVSGSNVGARQSSLVLKAAPIGGEAGDVDSEGQGMLNSEGQD